MVKRGKSRYIYCKKHPKHKQRQGFHTLAMSDFEGGDSAIDSLESLFKATGLATSAPAPSAVSGSVGVVDMASIERVGLAASIMRSALDKSIRF